MPIGLELMTIPPRTSLPTECPKSINGAVIFNCYFFFFGSVDRFRENLGVPVIDIFSNKHTKIDSASINCGTN